MRYAFVISAATLIGVVSIASFADDTSAPVPIHRTTAKRHTARQVKKPVTPNRFVAPAKPAASGAK